jgi:cell division protein ZapA (FtsZ GTPase activity inhibitor)
LSSLGISIHIAGRAYKLTVDSEAEEEMVRKAAAHINEKVKVYSENFSFKDHQDLLAMVCLEIASKSISNQRLDGKQKDTLIESLEEINNLLQ